MTAAKTRPGSGAGDATRPRAVAIGGGHGCARTLLALQEVTDDITAVVTVADDGGSSGRLRRDHDIVALGDLRRTVAALAPDSELTGLVQHRFRDGELAGHSLGNLLLLGMLERSEGDTVVALERFGTLLGARGCVLPCTTSLVTLRAESASGREVVGQVEVMATRRLERLRLDPEDPSAPPEAVAAILAADLVVLGPGSLYTSLLPNLLVPAIADAVRATEARVVLVANAHEQRGETEGMSLADHVRALVDHVPGLRVDVLVVDAGEGRTTSRSARSLALDADALTASGTTIGALVTADLIDADGLHDPARLAEVLRALVRA